MELVIQREHFYYIFNLMIPTTLVTVVAIIGFHAPSSSAPRRETKFRLGIMTLLSMGVMLLMVVEEMPKFSLASIPGQRGSFSDVPILGIYYIFLIFCISTCTCTTSIFVLLERHALEHPEFEKIPCYLRWLDFDFSEIFSCCDRSPQQSNTEMMISVESRSGGVGDGERKMSNDKETMDKSVRFGEKDDRLRQADTHSPSPAVELFHATSSEQNIRPPPLYHRSSWNRRPSPIGYQSPFALGDPLDSLSRPLDRMADTLSVISQRLLHLQSKLGSASASGAESSATPPSTPGKSGTDYGRAKRRKTSIARRQSAATRGQPILTKSWHRIISRIELMSLTVYLMGILAMIILVFNHNWY